MNFDYTTKYYFLFYKNMPIFSSFYDTYIYKYKPKPKYRYRYKYRYNFKVKLRSRSKGHLNFPIKRYQIYNVRNILFNTLLPFAARNNNNNTSNNNNISKRIKTKRL